MSIHFSYLTQRDNLQSQIVSYRKQGGNLADLNKTVTDLLQSGFLLINPGLKNTIRDQFNSYFQYTKKYPETGSWVDRWWTQYSGDLLPQDRAKEEALELEKMMRVGLNNPAALFDLNKILGFCPTLGKLIQAIKKVRGIELYQGEYPEFKGALRDYLHEQVKVEYIREKQQNTSWKIWRLLGYYSYVQEGIELIKSMDGDLNINPFHKNYNQKKVSFYRVSYLNKTLLDDFCKRDQTGVMFDFRDCFQLSKEEINQAIQNVPLVQAVLYPDAELWVADFAKEVKFQWPFVPKKEEEEDWVFV